MIKNEQHRCHRDHPPRDCRGGNGAPSSSDWWQKLQTLAFSLVTGPNSSDYQQEDVDRQIKRRNRTVVSIIMLVFAIYLRRLRRRTNTNDNNIGFPLLSSLLASWKSLHNMSSKNGYRNAVDAPLSLLLQAAKTGGVTRALLMASDSSIAFQIDGQWKKSALPPNNPSLQSNLLELLSENGCTDVSALPESLLSRLATPALAALPFVYLYFVYRIMRNMHGKDDVARTYQSRDSQVSFENVAGLDSVVMEVSEVVRYLSNPSMFTRLGARPPRGVLLYGPPGSGKTLLARAIAGEAQCNTFVACSGSDFVDTYVGRGASRVRKLFDQARRDARGGSNEWWPCRNKKNFVQVPSAVIFIDEIDALAKSRSSFGNNDERDQTLNQLLAEMDGFAVHNDVTMIVIAATNRPDVLDPAILRRFDRQVHVGYPDAKGREAILVVHANGVNCNIARIDWRLLAATTNGFSGADLRNVVNEAALMAVREQRPEIDQRHFAVAIDRVKRMKVSVQSPLPTNLEHLMRL